MNEKLACCDIAVETTMIPLSEFGSEEWIDKHHRSIYLNQKIQCHEKSCNNHANFKVVHGGYEQIFYCLDHTKFYIGLFVATGYPLPIIFEITYQEINEYEYQIYRKVTASPQLRVNSI